VAAEGVAASLAERQLATLDPAGVALPESVLVQEPVEFDLGDAAQDPRRLDPPFDLFVGEHRAGLAARTAPRTHLSALSFDQIHVASKTFTSLDRDSRSF
jgi:hypothetical protein